MAEEDEGKSRECRKLKMWVMVYKEGEGRRALAMVVGDDTRGGEPNKAKDVNGQTSRGNRRLFTRRRRLGPMGLTPARLEASSFTGFGLVVESSLRTSLPSL